MGLTTLKVVRFIAEKLNINDDYSQQFTGLSNHKIYVTQVSDFVIGILSQH